jgi:hypothetical protein
MLETARSRHSDVAEREAYKAAWARDPMNWLWFSGDAGKKTFDNQLHFVISVFYSLIRFE